MSSTERNPETGYEPTTLEHAAASTKAGAQPPPPPPESDPNQEYGDRHTGIARPASNDADQPLEDYESAPFPDRAETLGVRRDALRDA